MAAKRLREQDRDELRSAEDERLRSFSWFQSVFQEAVKARSFQSICLAFEPLLRRVVKEEVERGMLFRSARSLQRYPQVQIQVVETSRLQLVFSKPLSLPIFTGSKIEGESCNPLQILLVDTCSGKPPAPLPSPIRVEIVALDGDFPPKDRMDWSSAEFESSIVRERAGKRPLLTGDVLVSLRVGVASIGELIFTDNSSWIRSRKFRLGARVVQEKTEAPRIKEAMTEPFTVREHRGESYKKHHPPALGDEVWRLQKIGKDGTFHTRLANEGLNTVQDVLKLWVVNPLGLRQILGAGMSDRMWEVTINHAKTCILGDSLYLYHGPNCSILLNPICQVVGLILDGMKYSPHQLTREQRAYVEKQVLEAYNQWDKLEVIEEPFHDEPNHQVAIGFSQYSDHYETLNYMQRPRIWNLNRLQFFDNHSQEGPSSRIHTSITTQRPAIQPSDAHSMSGLSLDTDDLEVCV